MNQNQKLAILAGCVAAILLCVFPPIEYQRLSHNLAYKEYEPFRLITDIGSYGKIMTADLGFRILVVAGLTFAGFRVTKT